MNSKLSKKILVVDDEFEIVQTIKIFLELSGYEHIFEACSGKEALRIIQTEDVDLIISDVRMPEMDGIDLIKLAKELYPEKPIFLMISGYSELTSEKAKELGAKELLVKPLDLDHFIEIIDSNLQD